MASQPGQHGSNNLTPVFTRRAALRSLLGTAGVALLAACGGGPAATVPATTAPAASVAPTVAAGGAAIATVAPTTGRATATRGAAATAGRATSTGSGGATPVASGAIDGKIPSPNPNLGVPDAYTKLPPSFKAIPAPPGKGSKVTGFQISYDPPLPPRDQNKYVQELEKRLNLSAYEVTLAPASSYEEKFAAMVAGGDLPDMMLLTPPPGWQKIAQQGAFTDLTEYLTGDMLKMFPNLATFPGVLWNNVALNKKVYGVPRPRFLANNSYYFRQDWAEKVGFGQQKNAEDFYKMAVAFTKNDPDGNGKSDSFGLSSSSPRPNFGVATDAGGPLGEMFRVPNGWRLNSDKTLVNAVETDEWKQALAFARRLWEGGAFHPDSATLQTTQNKDLFYSSKLGAYSDGLAGLMGSGGAYGMTRAQNPNANVTGWVAVGHDGGKPAYHKYIGFFGFTAVSAKAGRDKERVKELLGILNYFAAPFGSEEWLFNGYGVAGVHHTIGASGAPVRTDQGKAEIGTGTYTGLTNAVPVAYYDLPGNAEEMQRVQAGLLANGIDNPTWGYYSATWATKQAELEQLQADRIVSIVTGREPLNAWDTFVTDWKSRGGDQVRKEFEAAIRG